MANRDRGVLLGLLALGALWLFSRKAGAAGLDPGASLAPRPVEGPSWVPTPDEEDDPSELADVSPGPGQVPTPKPMDLPTVPQVGAWISGTPQVGRFYQIQQGDTGSSVANAALGGAGGAGQYLATLNLNPWNRALYSTPYDASNGNWPAYTSADGLVVGKAFLPRHQNAGIRIVNGQPVQRNIKDNKGGAQLSGAFASYGLLWLPSEENPTPPPFIMEIAGL